MKEYIRLGIFADLHCGHIVGLTHPDFDARPQSQERIVFRQYQSRRTMYKFYEERLDMLRPIDIAIVNGDCIEGKGEKSGSTELLTADRNEQVDMAVAAIRRIGASQLFLTYGTPYHSGAYEDWEQQVADAVGAEKIGGHDWIDVRGVIIDYRHYISNTSVPHTRGSMLGRENIWNLLWAERDEYPRASILIRSHVHAYAFTGDATWLGMTTPALQGYGTKFGTRRMSSTVDFGFIVIDVYSKGRYTWQAEIARLKRSAQAAVKVREPSWE